MSWQERLEALFATIWSVTLLIEHWLSITNRVRAGSLIGLAWNFCHGVYEFFAGKVRSDDSGGTTMSIESKSVQVSGPIYGLLKAIEEIVADTAEKRTDEIPADLMNGLTAASKAFNQAAPDYAENPAAVRRAVVLGVEEMVERLVSVLSAKGAPTPGK